MKDKIDAIIAKFGQDFMEQISDSPDVIGNEILTLIAEEIEKVENPYPEDRYHVAQRIAFGEAIVKILALLK